LRQPLSNSSRTPLDLPSLPSTLYKQAAKIPANPAKPKTYFPISTALPPLVVTGLGVAEADALTALEDDDEGLEELEELFAGLDVVVTTTAAVVEGLVVEVEVMVLLDGLVLVAGMREVEVDVLVDALEVCGRLVSGEEGRERRTNGGGGLTHCADGSSDYEDG
jgi:hypothetical protein